MKETVSFNGTHNNIQNYCVTFTHNFIKTTLHHTPSRFKNSFVIKAADVDVEKAKKIAEILFPKYTDIEIESVDNDTNTLTPSEYQFIRGKLMDLLPSKEEIDKRGETDYDKYLLTLCKKMTTRMQQFPVYHT